MSTFKGIIDEFPDIRIDYFRPDKDPNARAPLACFLTHIHSDHIQGLDGFYGGPFIHCSAATKELLLRLERRTHRWNLAKGVLESRKCQYAEKKTKLKVIPLETPTVVELSSEKSVRVTLFDANHCPGAVMFLIEGDGKAVLYTGDIRAEPWWVDYLSRHPILVPYTTGIKRLNKIYLDTTFTAQKETYQLFQSKSDGIRELIGKVGEYPQDTIFHFNTWTFGYEDVWVALAAALNTKIHLSDYHFRLFHFIRSPEVYTNGPYLKGYKFGNTEIPGCLTKNPEARFHSCERRAGCCGLEGKKNVVWITPVIARIGDLEIHEAGSGDLENQDDLVLYEDHLQLLLDGLGPDVDLRVKELLKGARNTRKQALALDLLAKDGSEDLGLSTLLEMLSKAVISSQDNSKLTRSDQVKDTTIVSDNGEILPNKITFPYSRHSSYSELRGLVAVFRPRDIYPCVVEDEDWDESKAMGYLFGDLCEGNEFVHDKEMREKVDEEQRMQEAVEEERAIFEMESQMMLDRADSPPPFGGGAKIAENRNKNGRTGLQYWAEANAFGLSATSYAPVLPWLTTPRPLKRSVEDDGDDGEEDDDDDTPKARRVNPLVVNNDSESPPLPPMLSPEYRLRSSDLTPLEAARLEGSSTASSSSPQCSPIRPRPKRPTVETIAAVRKRVAPLELSRASKRIKREESSLSSQQEFFDAPDKVGTTPWVSRRNSNVPRLDNRPMPPKYLENERIELAILDEVDFGVNEVDQEEAIEAIEAVLGIDGKSWWDVELRSTEKKWRHVEEIEL